MSKIIGRGIIPGGSSSSSAPSATLPKMHAPTSISLTNGGTFSIGLPSTNGDFCTKAIVHLRRPTTLEAEYHNTIEIPISNYQSPFTFNLDNYTDTSGTEYVRKEKSHVTVSLGSDNFEMSDESATKSYSRRFNIILKDGDDVIGTEYVRYAQLPATVPSKAGHTFQYWSNSEGTRVYMINGETVALWAVWS